MHVDLAIAIAPAAAGRTRTSTYESQDFPGSPLCG